MEIVKHKNTNQILQIFTHSPKQELLISKVSNSNISKIQEIISKLHDRNYDRIQEESEEEAEKSEFRLAILAQNGTSVLDNLRKKNILAIKSDSQFRRPKIAFLFTGQGSQYGGMARSLYETSDIFRSAFDDCTKLLDNNLPIPMSKVLWGDYTVMLEQSAYSQTSLFCVEYALVQLWKSFNVRPDFVLGPSAGAFAAAVTAGILSMEDALKLVSERGKLIQNLPTGGMTSVKALYRTVQKIIDVTGQDLTDDDDYWLDIAVINSPDDIVVAGRPSSLAKFEKVCLNSGIKTKRLDANQAFHSRDIEGIHDEYQQIIGQVEFKSAESRLCGYVAGVDGRSDADVTSTNYWQSHARDPVDFPASIHSLYDLGCRIFIEIGPQPTLITVGQHNVGPEKAGKCLWLPTLRRREMEWTTFLSNLGQLWVEGVNVCWKENN